VAGLACADAYLPELDRPAVTEGLVPMPTMNMKNIPLSAAGTDLGLGNQLTNQLQDEMEEEKKRRALMGTGGAAADLGLMSPNSFRMAS
jgi:hypothetical protein